MVVKKGDRDKYGRWTWLCKCHCGKFICIKSNNLRTGNSKSCGCGKVRFVHGKHGTGSYKSWYHMLSRVRHHPLYKGVGIDPRWYDFRKFYKDMGDRPSKKTLDRRNPSGPYCKSNCRWASRKRQSRNRRNATWVVWKGRPVLFSDLVEMEGVVPYSVVRTRHFRLNWGLKESLKTPRIQREGKQGS